MSENCIVFPENIEGWISQYGDSEIILSLEDLAKMQAGGVLFLDDGEYTTAIRIEGCNE